MAPTDALGPFQKLPGPPGPQGLLRRPFAGRELVSEPVKEDPLTSKIHLVCKQAQGLRIVDKKAFVFESEGWLLSAAEMAAFKGGDALLHETKAKPSYFGGTVLDVRAISGGDDESGHVRCVLTIQSTAAAKGVKWDQQGQRNAIARTDGIVAVPE